MALGDGGGVRPAAVCLELLLSSDAAAAVSPSPPLTDGDGAALPAADGSPLSFIGSRWLPVDSEARLRPALCVRMDAAAFSAHPRACSVLSRGLKVRVPSSVPRVWRSTRRSAIMTKAVADFVTAGILAPGQPRACYPLFAVSKTVSVARLVYDSSSLTLHMPHRLAPIFRPIAARGDGVSCWQPMSSQRGLVVVDVCPHVRVQ